ncbi:MAG: hypothetical protein LC796_03175 [Acidobacteria bacterium]|nr:hypothetical protein [Acidobacteriota bacterium]MCA1609761.1 hypothetical protein [Acidobacteriota bacterium]
MKLRISVLAISLMTSGFAAALAAQEATPPPQETPTPAPTAPDAPPPAPPPQAPAGGGSSQTSNYFNPSISVIGNFLGVAGRNPVENLPNLSLRESELGLQAIVDPYARADFFLSFNGSNVDVEEGYLTFTALPAQFLAKVGRMRVQFGKINTLHLHVLPWADEPLPIVNLLGGEEGWIGDGVSISHLLPMPADLFSELTLQVFRGDSGELFAAPHRSDLAYNAHYRAYGDISESSNLELGFSYGYGPNTGSTDEITRHTRLEAIDATFRWKPLRQGNYRSASIRGELYRSRRDQSNGRQTARGWFLSGEYQLAKRWFTGARVESSDHADEASRRDTGQALLLTFWPSEFSQLRGELRRRRYAGGINATEALLQLQFAIGAHGAHPF